MTKKLLSVEARWLYDDDIMPNRRSCRAFAVIGVYDCAREEVSRQQLSTSIIAFEGRDKFLDAAMRCFEELKALLHAFDVSTLRFNNLISDWKQREVL